MSEPMREANDADLAEQAALVDDEGPDAVGEPDAPDEDFSLGEADPADVFEQHQRVPSPDDDYDR